MALSNDAATTNGNMLEPEGSEEPDYPEEIMHPYDGALDLKKEGETRSDPSPLISKQKLSVRGGQADISLVHLKAPSGRIEAVLAKTYRYHEYYRHELKLIKMLQAHPHIVNLAGDWNAYEIRSLPLGTLFLKYYELGDLHAYSETFFSDDDNVEWGFIPEKLLWKVLYQMGSALGFMHNGRGRKRPGPAVYVHRDIKPENILLVASSLPGGSYDFRLCDFGLAEHSMEISGLSRPSKHVGTYAWQAGECVHYPYLSGPAQDIWSLGGALHFLVTGEYGGKGGCNEDCDPDYHSRCVNLSAASCGLKRTQRDGFVEDPWCKSRRIKYSDEIITWIRRLLSNDPDQRPTGSEICDGVETIYRQLLNGGEPPAMRTCVDPKGDFQKTRVDQELRRLDGVEDSMDDLSLDESAESHDDEFGPLPENIEVIDGIDPETSSPR